MNAAGYCPKADATAKAPKTKKLSIIYTDDDGKGKGMLCVNTMNAMNAKENAGYAVGEVGY